MKKSPPVALANDPRRTAAGRAGLAALAGLLLLAAAPAAAGGSPARAAPPPRLASALVLRDGQGGVTGEAGTVVTVEPDGRFRVARFVGRRTEPPHHTGRLPAPELRRLARALAAALEPPLPRTIVAAEPPGANPHRLQLRYRGRVSTLSLPPGAAPEAAVEGAAPGADPTARFLRAFLAAQRAVGEEREAPVPEGSR